MKINLFSFFPRKVRWKHTKTRVLHGRGKEDKSPVRGRKLLGIAFFNFSTTCKEDKSPVRGRKLRKVLHCPQFLQ